MDAFSALIDFSSAACPDAPRLRCAFGAPREILAARTPAEVRPLLDRVHAHALQGRWCVGYLRYEAAPAFDPALAAHDADGPLAWFGVHDSAQPWPEAGDGAAGAAAVRATWDDGLARPLFDRALADIQRAIAGGALYQVNFTAPLRGVLSGAADAAPRTRARALFDALQRAQPGGYAAFIDAGAEQVLSVSPELFFDWRERRLLARPMKGTAARGATPADDAAAEAGLRASARSGPRT